ncbi:hypothetical protein JCM24511_01778 [Saitozyma sp. JCM 24511]|nr:hypothetical protein JCM24511_01778 [Saitozyma sp. JCM 24511]
MLNLANLLSLLLVLPFLLSPVEARHGDRLSRRHSHSHHQHGLIRAVPNVSSLEERLAKRNAKRSLARRGGPVAQSICRTRGVSYSPSATSSTASSTAPASTTTSTWAAASSSTVDNQQNYAQPTSAAPAASSAAPASANSYASFTPNGKKAGLSAGDAYDAVQAHIGWWYDWTPNPTGHSGTPVGVSMIWGAGTADSTDAARLAEFEAMNWNPSYIIGFEEPDCAAGSGSAGMDVATGVALWNQYVAPKGQAGSVLISPSMCKQAAESGWLGPFRSQISRDWDITNVHINKNSAAGISLDLDHYWNTYGKPMWITEFACVDDSTGFVPCTDQNEINSFIWTAVQMFESDSRVAGYAYSNGAGLGNMWPMWSNGALSESGQQYLNAISQYS